MKPDTVVKLRYDLLNMLAKCVVHNKLPFGKPQSLTLLCRTKVHAKLLILHLDQQMSQLHQIKSKKDKRSLELHAILHSIPLLRLRRNHRPHSTLTKHTVRRCDFAKELQDVKKGQPSVDTERTTLVLT